MQHNRVYGYPLLFFAFLTLWQCRPKPTAEPANPLAGKIPVQYLDTLERQYNSLNEAIYYIFRDVYLWNTNTPKNFDFNSVSDPQKLIDQIKKTPEDRFSYITDKLTSDDFFDRGQKYDPGFYLGIDATDSVAVFAVDPNSAADKAGLHRGMLVTKIGGKDIYKAIADKSAFDLLSEKTLVLELRDSTGRFISKTITGAPYVTNTVYSQKILTVEGKKVGYFVLSSFIQTSEKELSNTFAYFKSNGIQELIVDLRYNGGGLLTVGNYLASHIAGSKSKGKSFAKINFNDTYKSLNESIRFADTLPNVIDNLSRVFFITTSNTASASEAVINSLYPIFGTNNVFIVGDQTYGKPVGSIGFGYKDKLIFPIVLAITNHAGQGNYFNGLVPNAYRSDIVRYNWGDPRDNILSEALHYISKGSFSGKMQRTAAREALASFRFPNTIANYPMIYKRTFEHPLKTKDS